MKTAAFAALILSLSSVEALNNLSFGSGKKSATSTSTPTPAAPVTLDDLPGAIPPVGLFDPLGFGSRASPDLLRKYREAEITHGRVAMVAVLGFLVGEAVQGVTPLFDGKISGAGITQLSQVPAGFWISFAAATFAVETLRVRKAIYDPATCSPDQIGKYKDDHIPGDIGFDPLGLRPSDPDEFVEKQTKELQNGRLAMIGASGFLAQELSDKKGIVDHAIGGLELPSFELPFELPF